MLFRSNRVPLRHGNHPARIDCEPLETRRLFTIPGTQLDIWHTYTQATNDLNTIHNAYPTLTRLISIGKTVQNRDMWAMEITDNPGVEEDEPEFLYNGQIHGDEPVGMENSMHFIQYLLENYNGTGGDGPRVTNLVNNMDVWVVPSSNWDGYSKSGGAWRYNASGIDLNRNFPEWTTRSFTTDTKLFGPYGNMFDGPTPPNTTGLAAETINMMNFRRSHNFVASATFHGGDLVVNYEWDSNGNAGADYATSPDDALLRDLALVYSTQNGPMFANNAAPFDRGTTNGDNWYPISGGEQDWSYIYTGSTEFTIELGFTKYPAATQLPTLWSQNRESMLQFLEAANWGLRGTITSAATGQPLFAKVTVISPSPSPTPDANHPSTHPVFSDADLGDYHRQLEPGTYTLKFEAAGYQPKTISGVVVGAKTNSPLTTARLDVQLLPVDTTAPTVTGAQFTYNASPQQTLSFMFSEPVQNLDATDLILQNNTTGTPIPSGNIALAGYDSATRTATFTSNYPGGTLPGGSYTASLRSTGVQDLSNNNLAAGYAYNFLYAAGTGGADAMLVKRSAANLNVWFGSNPAGPTYSAPFASLSNLSIDTLGGDDALTLDFSAGEIRPSLAASGFGWRMGGGHESLTLAGAVNYAFTADPATTETPNLSLNLSGGATATLSAPVFHLDALGLATGTSASLPAGGGQRTLVVAGSLSILGTATLDLADHAMVVRSGGLAALQPLVVAGCNHGAWNGAGGIVSTAAAADANHLTGLGAASNAELNKTSFAGVTGLTPADVLVRYTYNGDSDLTGGVTLDDFTLFLSGYQTGKSTWNAGDYDYSNSVTLDDFTLFLAAYQRQGPPIV
jgi:carboxypeptidase D